MIAHIYTEIMHGLVMGVLGLVIIACIVGLVFAFWFLRFPGVKVRE